jgi:peptidoglycan/xylan/chitin deacetylase (PgdA/CDA1 family)
MQWVRALSGVSLVVPYYHMVSDASVPHVRHLYQFRTIAEFNADLEFLLHRFEPVTLSEIVGALNGVRALRRPSFHLTFDDGFTEIHDIVAPILERAGVAATFFLNTAFLDGGGLAHHNALSVLLDRLQSPKSGLGSASFRRIASLLPVATSESMSLEARILSIGFAQQSVVDSLAEILHVDLDAYVRETRPYLSSEQIARLLSKGFTIGAHSHDHPLYADLSLPEQLAQTRKSMHLLATQFVVAPKAFAFPHSDSGVEAPFFAAVFSNSFLDVSFGTAGLLSHFHPRNIERISMEEASTSAAQILARQFARAMYFKVRQRR